MIGIYKIENPKGKIYIGQSINIEIRWSVYKKINCKNQIKLERSLLKYGIENHIFSFLEECEESDLNIKERYWQEFYDVLKSGLNCKLTETSDKKGILSFEIKDKISNSLKGKKHTEERILKNKESNTGKKLSKNAIEKLKSPKGPHKILECPKCNKKGGSHSMKRYHFDNCGKKFGVKKFKCTICNLEVGGKSNLKRHEEFCRSKLN